MSYRVLLVDDEPLARERLKRLLQEHSQFECAGDVGNGEAALDWLARQHADQPSAGLFGIARCNLRCRTGTKDQQPT